MFDEDEDDHFPWHYTELGVICACGMPMRDEECPALLRVPEGNHDAQREPVPVSAASRSASSPFSSRISGPGGTT